MQRPKTKSQKIESLVRQNTKLAKSLWSDEPSPFNLSALKKLTRESGLALSYLAASSARTRRSHFAMLATQKHTDADLETLGPLPKSIWRGTVQPGCTGLVPPHIASLSVRHVSRVLGEVKKSPQP
jgi:hypothetical protein